MKIDFDDSYSFISPYITSVETSLSVSITKGTATSDSKPSAPAVLHGQLTQAADGKWQIAYSVSCDLRNVLRKGRDSIKISGAEPAKYNGTLNVVDVDQNTVFLDAGDIRDPYLSGATIAGTSCPPTSSDPVVISFGINSMPKASAYLYLKKNAFFSDTINLSFDNNGMLSNSDSASAQQITAILTALAQTAAPFLLPILNVEPSKTVKRGNAPTAPSPADRQVCFSALATQVKYGPYYDMEKLGNVYRRGIYSWKIDLPDPRVKLAFDLEPARPSRGVATFNEAIGVNSAGETRKIHWNDGFVAFFPVATKAKIYCEIAGVKPIYLAAPSNMNLYSESAFLDPQRDFFTNPQNTFTFNAGFITGHKYVAQSAAKTVVDTITQPIRAMMPSVSVQQNTQVQTGGGKPDQTTTTTSTTTSPPKAP